MYVYEILNPSLFTMLFYEEKQLKSSQMPLTVMCAYY